MIFYPFYKCPRCHTNNTVGPLFEEGCEIIVCQQCLLVYDISDVDPIFFVKKNKSNKEADYNQIDPMEE